MSLQLICRYDWSGRWSDILSKLSRLAAKKMIYCRVAVPRQERHGRRSDEPRHDVQDVHARPLFDGAPVAQRRLPRACVRHGARAEGAAGEAGRHYLGRHFLDSGQHYLGQHYLDSGQHYLDLGRHYLPTLLRLRHGARAEGAAGKAGQHYLYLGQHYLANTTQANTT